MGELRLGLFDLPEFGALLDLDSRPRKNRARPVWRAGAERAPAERPISASTRRLRVLLEASRRVPEVMVKITGTNTEAAALAAHLTYLRRKDEAEIEDERGNAIEPSAEGMRRVLASWGVAIAEGRENERKRERAGPPLAERPRHDSRKTIAVHVVLSMPKGTDATRLMGAVRAFAGEEFQNHQHVLVLHTDRDHPHVHVVVNNVGNDLQRLPRKRADLQRWREVFARELRALGIEAAATPRKVRGVIQKGESFVVRQAKTRLARERAAGAAQPVASLRVLREQAERAINERGGVVRHEPAPAEARARANRTRLERGLADAVRTLRAQGDRATADTLAALLSRLPAPMTALDALQAHLANVEASRARTVRGATSERVRPRAR